MLIGTWIELVNIVTIASFAAAFIFFVVRAPQEVETSEVNRRLTWSRVIQRHGRALGIVSIIGALVMLGFIVTLELGIPATHETTASMPFRLHVLTELLAAAGLLIAGGALTSGGHGAAPILFAAIGLLVASTLFSLHYFGIDGNPMAMDIVAISLVILLVAMAGSLFFSDFHRRAPKTPKRLAGER